MDCNKKILPGTNNNSNNTRRQYSQQHQKTVLSGISLTIRLDNKFLQKLRHGN